MVWQGLVREPQVDVSLPGAMGFTKTPNVSVRMHGSVAALEGSSVLGRQSEGVPHRW
jgi:hypothetical protein